jgi:L-ascorbate metabolism protein UlaG (beta-lactamase superfamily)
MILHRAQKMGAQFQNPIDTQIGGPRMMLKILPQYLSNKEERFPKHPLGPFKTDVTVYQQPPRTGLRVTWFGHSSLLIEMDGARILIDPVWDERASPVSWAGPKRFFPPTLPLDELPKLDAVLISHNHYDHLGKRTIRHLSGKPVKWICPLNVGRNLQNFGVPKDQITELDWTESVPIAGLSITALPARHFSGRGVSDRFQSLWASFVLKGDRHNLYHGADSGLWPGFAEIGGQYGPFDLTLLEIGAYNEHWKSIHMGPDGAAQAFQELGGHGLFMPIHWGLFDLALHAWRQPIQRLLQLGLNGKIWSPEPGQPTDVIAGQPLPTEWWKT